jgi:hypothetical protein
MRRVDPTIQYLHDLDTALTEIKSPRSFLASITGITFNLHIESRFASCPASQQGWAKGNSGR